MTLARAFRRLLVAHVAGLLALAAAAPLAVAAADPQSELAMRVDDAAFTKGRMELLVMETRRALRVARVSTSSVETKGLTVRAALRRPLEMDRATAALRSHFGLDEAASHSAAEAEVSIGQDTGSVVSASLLEAGVRSSLALVTDQSVERIRYLIPSHGVRDGTVVRDELGVIRIRAPRKADIEGMKGTVIDRGAVGLWRLVDVPQGRPDAAETTTLRQRTADGAAAPVEAHRRIILTAHEMVDARQSVDPMSGRPAVRFRLDRLKSGRWSEALAANAGARVAVAIGEEILVTGRLDRASDAATAEISGDFPVDKAVEVAALLRLGMYPAPLVRAEGVSPGVTGAPQRAPN